MLRSDDVNSGQIKTGVVPLLVRVCSPCRRTRADCDNTMRSNKAEMAADSMSK